MGKADDKLREALSGKKIPIVTLDNKWHKIWTMIDKPGEIAKNEARLNELLRAQGRMNSETKEIKKIKKRLMDEIVTLADSNASAKKLDENKRLIEECNQKLEQYEEELLDIPNRIAEINRELMYSTMEQCYHALHTNEKDIERLADWIAGIRIELKKNVVRKQEMEIQNAVMYSYMNDVFGGNIVDLFDLAYNPMDKIIKLKEAKKDSVNGK